MVRGNPSSQPGPAYSLSVPKKTTPAVVSVVHNGVKVHDKRLISGPTGFGEKEENTPRPLYLQNHGNPVMFRNVWLVEIKE